MAVTQTLHTPEKEIAQVVIVKVDERFVMTVLSASWNMNRHRLQDVCMPHHVRLATEGGTRDLLPDCESGAIPPFGTPNFATSPSSLRRVSHLHQLVAPE